MANKRSKKTTARDSLPEHFSSLEEAAEFWDTHDSGDYEEYFKDVDCKFNIKTRTHLISMDSALYDEVRAIAKKKRIPTEKLVTRWIKEKLRSAA
jgi:CopG antitoxin of type II toxin-antitoxin system